MENRKFTHSELHDRLESIRSARGESKASFYGDSGAGRSLPDNLKKKTFPSIEKIVALADYLGCSVDYLLGRETEGSISAVSEDKWKAILDQLSDESLEMLEEYLDFLLWKQGQCDQASE